MFVSRALSSRRFSPLPLVCGLVLLAISTRAQVVLDEQVTSTAADTPPPNIIFMFADDLGWFNVGFHGNSEVHTPAIDELAHSGVILDRVYTFKYCSPTRSSFLSGRLPLHVTQNNKNNLVTNPGGADLRMTLLPARLKEAGYRTGMVGKWHVGARSEANLPINRGFDSHFGFLKGGEDHWNQTSKDEGIIFTDLWRDHAPALNENGTFSTLMYAAEASRVIRNHAATQTSAQAAGLVPQPLFLYLPWHAVHTPLEAPADRITPVDNDPEKIRSMSNGLIRMLDEGVKNVTQTLKDEGLWNNTLLIFQADNGGWLGNLGGNNWPLRGGKVSDWEGGVRVAAFANGGYLTNKHPELKGTRNQGLIDVCDWYSTFLGLAGITDPADPSGVGEVPGIDSIDVWSSVITPNANATDRVEIPLSFCNAEAECYAGMGDAALIVGQYKLVVGSQAGLGVWQGLQYPNGTKDYIDAGCPDGCLFDIFADPTEHNDISDDKPDIFKQLQQRLAEIGTTVYQTNYSGGYDMCIGAQTAFDNTSGFLSPRCTTN